MKAAACTRLRHALKDATGAAPVVAAMVLAMVALVLMGAVTRVVLPEVKAAYPCILDRVVPPGRQGGCAAPGSSASPRALARSRPAKAKERPTEDAASPGPRRARSRYRGPNRPGIDEAVRRHEWQVVEYFRDAFTASGGTYRAPVYDLVAPPGYQGGGLDFRRGPPDMARIRVPHTNDPLGDAAFALYAVLHAHARAAVEQGVDHDGLRRETMTTECMIGAYIAWARRSSPDDEGSIDDATVGRFRELIRASGGGLAATELRLWAFGSGLRIGQTTANPLQACGNAA